MRGKLIMVENKKIEEEEQAQARKGLTDNSPKTFNVKYSGGHIKSLKFKGGLQIRGK